MKPRKPRPPEHLQTATKGWWSSVVRDYQLEDHHLRLLQLACEAWDRAQEARIILARDGIMVDGREGGVRPHPCIAIERDSRLAFARLLRELDLDVEAPPSERVGPPGLRSNRRGGYAG
jgi:P27 family predicted phage terminase small subunit